MATRVPRSDQRVFPRLAVAWPVEYRIVGPSGDAGFSAGLALNLSFGGMLLRAPQIPTRALPLLVRGEGTIEVCFDLGDGQPRLSLRSRLIWLQAPEAGAPDCRLGLMFLDVPDAARERLRAFVAAHAPA